MSTCVTSALCDGHGRWCAMNDSTSASEEEDLYVPAPLYEVLYVCPPRCTRQPGARCLERCQVVARVQSIANWVQKRG
jgi:hypothetical protein